MILPRQPEWLTLFWLWWDCFLQSEKLVTQGNYLLVRFPYLQETFLFPSPGLSTNKVCPWQAPLCPRSPLLDFHKNHVEVTSISPTSSPGTASHQPLRLQLGKCLASSIFPLYTQQPGALGKDLTNQIGCCAPSIELKRLRLTPLALTWLLLSLGTMGICWLMAPFRNC